MSRVLGLIGKYELQRLLGRGSLAEVWKAFDTRLKRSVALKLLHSDLQVDPNFITRFEREMPVISSLGHPNIVQIFDYQVFRPRGSDNLKAYIVMNYVKGRTLADYIRHTSRAGQFPSAADMIHLFTAIGGAIDYAHQHGVIHADIKPSNILLDKQYLLRNLMGEPKLTDFGIAKMLATSTAKFNSQLSTSLYIAPEQALYHPSGNELSDIYSLGVILYEICTGKLPFEDESTADIMMDLSSSMPPSPASINANISQAASDVILRSLAKDPAERFTSASVMMRALAHALDVPIPENLGWFTSLSDQNGASPMLHPLSQSEQADLATSAASLESVYEPTDQKAPWSPPASPPATTAPSSTDLRQSPRSRRPGKSQQRAVEKPAPAPKPPRAPRSSKSSSFRSMSIVRKQAAEKLLSVLQKHWASTSRSIAGKVHNVPMAVDTLKGALFHSRAINIHKVHNVPVVDKLKGEDKQKIQGKRQKVQRSYLVACASLLLLLCTAGSLFSFAEYHTYNATYQHDMSLAREGTQHLQRGLGLFETLQQDPLDGATLQKAQHEFTASLMIFSQLDSELKLLPEISLSLPVYGTRLSAALHLLPIAIEVSQSGVIACNTLDLLISRFHNPLNTRAQGLTKADFSVLNQNFQQIKTILNLVIGQVNRLQPGDLQLDPRLNKLVTTFHKDIPALQSQLDVAEKILPIIPTVLGIGTPTNYLIEVLDSSELRPGGGFIDSYGIATFSGGQLTTAHITDVDLLDKPFEAAGGQIPFPAAYGWFDLASTWSFRDSNLDADFPTAARYGELTYKREGGKVPVQGVIAVTPGFIERALAITGPINVPEYHDTITAQNLVARIHYHQLGPGNQGNYSSQSERFIEVLATHFLAPLRQLSPPAFLKFLQLMINSLHTKHVQIYLNSSAAEHLLQSYHLDAAIQSPGSDSLFIVDANIGANKANSLISNVLNDQVIIDGEGNAVHHTTLRYGWVLPGQNYGSSLYRDYLRVYAPPGSTLQVQNGWEPRGKSEALGREVWAGFFTLSSGQTRTITLVWMVPGAAKKGTGGWDYQYTIQRQAGAQWTLHLQVTLPSCAGRITKLKGLVSSSPQAMTLTQSLNGDMNIGVDYTC